jgi:outer membrane protein assembly factor BamA
VSPIGTTATACAALLLVASGASAQESTASRIERAIVPLVGGDTDIGIGAGALGSIARTAPGDGDFRWKLEGAAFASLKSQAGDLGSPYQDVYLQLTRKDLWRGRLRLELRAAYTRESNLRYYGLGNAAPAPANDIAARDFFIRVHPAVRARVQYQIAGPIHVALGTMYMHNWIDVPPGSTLAEDAANGSPEVRDVLKLDRRHGLHLLQAGLIFDSRDDEIAPSTGQNHRFELRASPWRTPGLPYRYLGLSASLSGFVPLVTDRLILALRGVGDVQMGDVPFYELSRFDETSALGGPKYVRGVPSNRYYGKRKLLANVELRSQLAQFRMLRSDYQLGLTAFFDSGRVFADVSDRPALDGTGLGLKYGTGLGLRLQKGKTFVLRGDVAWSPDARPIAGYFLAEHIF